MASAQKAQRSSPLATTAPNPFAFNPSQAMEERARNQVDYISPQKRKNMKDYLSNSSINLANGQEKHYSSVNHFQSSNTAMLKNHGPPSQEALKQARDENNQKQRHQNIWMGRDNEFRNYRRPEQATVQGSVGKAMSIYSGNEGNKLRKHNFHFGFDDNQRVAKDQAIKSAAAKKSLYEYTKASQDQTSQWRKEQTARARVSNIKWGGKTDNPASPGNDRYKSSSHSINPTSATINQMNQTFTNMGQGTNTSEFQKDIKTIDSSRTTINQTQFVNARRSNLQSLDGSQVYQTYDKTQERALQMLNKGGKKIDMKHAQKQSVVGAHMVSPNQNEPLILQKGHMNREEVVQRMNSVQHQPTHIQIGLQNRSTSNLNRKPYMDGPARSHHVNMSMDGTKLRQMAQNSAMNPALQSRQKSLGVATCRTIDKAAAGSANLMSPLQANAQTLGANKRIGADMIKNNIRFVDAQQMVRNDSQATPSSPGGKDQLVAKYHNRNRDQSKVMGPMAAPTEQHHQGLYKASMNKGTSQVNWDIVTDNKAKIAEYQQRMLGQKQELGHMGHEKASSVKAQSYMQYGRQVYQQGHPSAQKSDAKPRDQRVQVNLAMNAGSKKNLSVVTRGTESREKFRSFAHGSNGTDSQEMISNLKASHVALGFETGTNSNVLGKGNVRPSANQEIGETSKMFSYVQQRGRASNVLPSNANAAHMKPTNAGLAQDKGSINRSTFKWANINVV